MLTQQSSLELSEAHHLQLLAPDTQSQVGSKLISPSGPLEVNQSEVSQPEQNPFPSFLENPYLDTMPYPYLRYTDGLDTESHIYAFVSTLQSNNSTLRLTVAEIEASKIMEFTLSLDGPAARWYSRHNPREFTTFALNSWNFSIAKSRSENCSSSSLPLAKNNMIQLPSSRPSVKIFTGSSPRMSLRTTFLIPSSPAYGSLYGRPSH